MNKAIKPTSGELATASEALNAEVLYWYKHYRDIALSVNHLILTSTLSDKQKLRQISLIVRSIPQAQT